jgi:hypothetical protein
VSDYNISQGALKTVWLNIEGKPYRFWQTPDRRWFKECNGKIRKTSGRRVANEIWLYGDKAQREEERLERQRLFERLRKKREKQQRQHQLQMEAFI